jgi:nitrile hydratase accessory protein
MNTSTLNERPLGAAIQEPEVGFGEPWQAEAFATTLQLSRAGVFTWTEWVEAFSATITREPERDGESIGDAYFRQWMTTLEVMLGRTLCVSEASVNARQALWWLAYLNTRHGEPVKLANAHEHKHPASHHTHVHSHGPRDGKRPTPCPATVIPARKRLSKEIASP